jgi:RNA polymerase sigma factor (sigma-70 family)
MEHVIELSPGVSKGTGIDFNRLYENCFPVVARFVGKMRGSLEDAADVFQDCLIVYHEKVMEGKIDLRVNADAYILGIAKHLWVRKFNRDRTFVSFDSMERAIEVPPDLYPSISTSRLTEFLESVGKSCLHLLRLFYFERKPLGEIAQRLKYHSEHSATVQKYKCIERLRESVKQKPDLYETLFE